MPPPRSSDEDDSEESSSGSSSPAIARRGKFDDEEEDSDVLDSWDAAEDSEIEREKAKKVVEAKAKADAEAPIDKRSKAQRAKERRMAPMKKEIEEEDESSSEEEDSAVVRARARQREQDADLKHAEDLVGNIGIGKGRSDTKTVVVADPSNPESAVDLSSLPIFNPNTKDQFMKLREVLVPILAANSKKAHYSLFMQEFSKQIVKDLPSDQIKKIASGLTTLSNEKMKEEKAAEKGGKKTKAATNKAKLVANRDVSLKADTTSYGDLEAQFKAHMIFHAIYLLQFAIVMTIKDANPEQTINGVQLQTTAGGDELYNYLLRHGAIPVEKVQKIFTQLVGAVVYVHNMSCVHRDLKLENILLDKHENVKLCDFGFTREYEGKLSYLQTFCGTVCYSAPEMLKGEKYAGEKVDVWSLGIILYALLTGELPFDDDDDMVAKHKILSSEPNYPKSLPPDAEALLTKLLSKRPLVRPSLADILTNPFLAEHAPQQQAILKLTQPLPFTTDLEKATLERMRSAGVDIDKVIENVLAQRCDALAGWWALLIEKEERKEKRRERKRREKEAEVKNMRRVSAASSRLERIAPTLKEVDEEGLPSPSLHASTSRGRRERRGTQTPQLVLPDLPRLPEDVTLASPSSPLPPPPIEKDSIRTRSISSTRRRPPPPPKERRISQGNTLQLISTNPDLLAPPPVGITKRRPPRKFQHPFLNQLASIKHWFKENAKRAKSPASKSDNWTLKNSPPDRRTTNESGRTPRTVTPVRHQTAVSGTPTRQLSGAPYTLRPKVLTPTHRASLSPAPITPRSSYRHSSGPSGLLGRKSTSSSVSSIRSIHHLPCHSKASSTSSTTNSIHSSVPFSKSSRSPHSSVKVLPSTPTVAAFPSNIRLVRAAESYNESANFNSSAGLVFAKRKRTPFRGSMLSIGTNTGSSSSGRRRDSSAGVSRSASAAGRTSGEIIEEEDEDEIEEVDAFSPLAPEAEETLWEPSKDSEGAPFR
ncbi:MAG: hypothetical protein Q9217_006098 [Psora testacea]